MNNWAKLHIFEPWSEEGVKQELLWHNNFITINGNTLLWREWELAGISCINDLWHPDLPRFLSDHEIRDKFQVTCSFLDQLQIRSSLPFQWKRLLTTSNPQPLRHKPYIVTNHQNCLDVADASSRKIYKALVLLKIPPIASQKKWNEIFPIAQDHWPEYWRNIYIRAFWSVRDSKHQAFQYRVIHRIIPCNKYLSNLRLRQDYICPNCGDQDTLPHFFYHCPIVHSLWTKLANWLLQNANFDLPLSSENVIFGIAMDSPSAKVSNSLFIYTKFFIYRQRLFHGSDLNLLHFLMELRSKIKVEKFLTDLEQKPNKFKGWKPILLALGWGSHTILVKSTNLPQTPPSYLLGLVFRNWHFNPFCNYVNFLRITRIPYPGTFPVPSFPFSYPSSPLSIPNPSLPSLSPSSFFLPFSPQFLQPSFL